MRAGEYVIRLKVDDKGAKASIDGVEHGLDQVKRKGKTTGKTVSAGFGKMKIAAFAAVAAIYAITRTLSKLVDAANEQERAEAKVTQGVKATGQAAGYTAEQLLEVASGLQKITTYGDEDILNNVTAQLLTFTNITGERFKQAQMAALNLATVLDGDLKSASIQLGKALNDPIANLSALSRSGIQFSEDQKKVIKSLWKAGEQAKAQSIILEELNRQYGGQAEALAKTDFGKLTQFGNRIGDIAEKLGALVLKGLMPVIEWINKVIDAIEGTSKGFYLWINEWVYTFDKIKIHARGFKDFMNDIFSAIGDAIIASISMDKGALDNAFSKLEAAAIRSQIRTTRRLMVAWGDYEKRRENIVNFKEEKADEKAHIRRVRKKQDLMTKFAGLETDGARMRIVVNEQAVDAILIAEKELDKTRQKLAEDDKKRNIERAREAQEIALKAISGTVDLLSAYGSLEEQNRNEKADKKRAELEEEMQLEREKAEQSKNRALSVAKAELEAGKITKKQYDKKVKTILAAEKAQTLAIDKEEARRTKNIEKQQRKRSEIEKAAMIFRALISTHEMAVKAFNAFVGIPFVGYALGIAAAIAATAFGMKQVAAMRATGFSKGGEFTADQRGFIEGGQTEIIAPKNTFVDVINRMISQKEIGTSAPSLSGTNFEELFSKLGDKVDGLAETFLGLELKVDANAEQLAWVVEAGNKQLSLRDI